MSEQYNFEKDIDVPSKQIIYDDMDVKDCMAYAKSQTVSLGDTVYKQMEKVCMVKNQPCKFFDCQFKQMARELKRKEQECDMWKNLTIDNGAVALKYQQQLDQLKEQLEAYKMESEEGKEINAELKAENEELREKCKKYGEINEQETKDYAELKGENDDLRKYKDVVDKLAGMQVILTNENGVPQLYDNAKDLKLKQLSKALTEIKPILEFYANSKIGVDKGNGIFEIEVSNDNFGRLICCYDTNPAKKALQKISECEVE